MNKSLHKLLPVLFGFFVMGFCDVVGISTSYVQQDFGLSETLAGFIPRWFSSGSCCFRFRRPSP